MPADLGELVLRERAGLAEHARVDGDLADVVERAAEPQDVEPVARPAEHARQALGEGGHAGRVAAQIRIPGLERVREGGEERSHRLRGSRDDARSLPRSRALDRRVPSREGGCPQRERRRRAPGRPRARRRRTARVGRIHGRRRARRRLRRRSFPTRSTRLPARSSSPRAELYAGADAVVRVGRPSAEEIAELAPGTVLIGFLSPLTDPDGIERLAARGRRRRSRWSRSRGSRAPSRWTRSRRRARSPATRRSSSRPTGCRASFRLLMTAAGTVAPGEGARPRRGSRRPAGDRDGATARRCRVGVRRPPRRARAGREPRRRLPRPRRRGRRRRRAATRPSSPRRSRRASRPRSRSGSRTWTS